MRIGIFIWLLIFLNITYADAQRLSLGGTLGMSAFHQTRFSDNFIFPKHSYFVYYTSNDKLDYKPIHHQYFNSGSAGLSLSIDYKRYMFSAEALFSGTTIKVPLLYPNRLGEIMDDDGWSTFQVNRNALVLPLLVYYKLTYKANGPFAIGGVQYSFNTHSEDKNFDLENSISYGIKQYISRTEMYNVLYNEYDYWSWIAGLGYKKNDNYYGLRLHQRIETDAAQMPDARYLQIDATYTRTLNFQKLRKGNIIYVD